MLMFTDLHCASVRKARLLERGALCVNVGVGSPLRPPVLFRRSAVGGFVLRGASSWRGVTARVTARSANQTFFVAAPMTSESGAQHLVARQWLLLLLFPLGIDVAINLANGGSRPYKTPALLFILRENGIANLYFCVTRRTAGSGRRNH